MGRRAAAESCARLVKKRSRRRYAMLGENTISTKALNSDQQRVALLQRNGFTRTDRFHVLYSRSLVEAPIVQPELGAGLRLRHATDDDLDARVDVHRDAWSVWGSVEGDRRDLSAAPCGAALRSGTRRGAGRRCWQISQLLHRMGGHGKRHRTFRAGRLSSRFNRTRIRARGDARGNAPDAGARAAHRAGRH